MSTRRLALLAALVGGILAVGIGLVTAGAPPAAPPTTAPSQPAPTPVPGLTPPVPRPLTAPPFPMPTSMSSFMPAGFKTPIELRCYCMGVQMGRGYKRQGMDVDLEALTRGMKDGLEGGKIALSEQ